MFACNVAVMWNKDLSKLDCQIYDSLGYDIEK